MPSLIDSLHHHAQRALPPLLLLAVLGGCQSLPPPATQGGEWAQQRPRLEALADWQLRGRVNVRYGDEAHTPRIQWQQQGQEYLIRLWGAFNAGNTRIAGGPGRVTLEQGGERHSAASPEGLMRDYLGYELPVSYLQDWVKGLPAAAGPQPELQLDTYRRLTGFIQEGWQVRYDDLRQYNGGLSLPRRVEVSKPDEGIRLRFVGLTWQPGG